MLQGIIERSYMRCVFAQKQAIPQIRAIAAAMETMMLYLFEIVEMPADRSRVAVFSLIIGHLIEIIAHHRHNRTWCRGPRCAAHMTRTALNARIAKVRHKPAVKVRLFFLMRHPMK